MITYLIIIVCLLIALVGIGLYNSKQFYIKVVRGIKYKEYLLRINDRWITLFKHRINDKFSKK